MILRSTPLVGGSLGGVNTDEANMKREAWSDKRSRTKNWMMVGRGRRRLGIGGTPSESDERDRKTNDWSEVSGRIQRSHTGKGPEWVVISRRFEEYRPRTMGGYRKDQSRCHALINQQGTHQHQEMLTELIMYSSM